MPACRRKVQVNLMTGNIRNILSDYLPDKLVEHSRRVAEMAEKLAASTGADVEKAYTAGWLHDIARHMTGDELLVLARQNRIVVDDCAGHEPVLLHGPVGACIAANMGFNDTDVLEAIAYHTTGKPDLGPVGQIVYLADKIEMGRDYPGVSELRRLAETDMAEALIRTVGQSLNYLTAKKAIIHPLTTGFWNWLIRAHVRK